MDLIDEKNLSKELVFNILDRVYMSPEHDSDGDILLRETHDVYVIVKEKTSSIKLMSVFQENESLERIDTLEQTNKILNQYPIGAGVTNNGGILFVHNLFVKGGVTEKNLILTIRQFILAITAIGTDSDFNIME